MPCWHWVSWGHQGTPRDTQAPELSHKTQSAPCACPQGAVRVLPQHHQPCPQHSNRKDLGLEARRWPELSTSTNRAACQKKDNHQERDSPTAPLHLMKMSAPSHKKKTKQQTSPCSQQRILDDCLLNMRAKGQMNHITLHE